MSSPGTSNANTTDGQVSSDVPPAAETKADEEITGYLPLESFAVQYFEEGSSITPAAYEGTEANASAYAANMFQEEDTDYNDLQNSYMENYMYSSPVSQFKEGTESTLDDDIPGLPLSCFNKIVKNIEVADYETLQALYEFLFLRSSWDTQELLKHRILDFSGFNFAENSEEYYNREVMLQTQQDTMLIKLGALLGLEIRMMLVDSEKGRPGLVSDIMKFVSKPKKKTRRRFTNAVTDTSSESKSNDGPECGCRNGCLNKFSAKQRDQVLEEMKEKQQKKALNNYLLSLISFTKHDAATRPANKRPRDMLYHYKAKVGNKLYDVCKGGFIVLHGIRMTKVNQLQHTIKSGGKLPKPLKLDPEPAPEEPKKVNSQDESTSEKVNIETSNSTPNSIQAKVDQPGPKSSKNNSFDLSLEDVIRIEKELKEKLATKKAPFPSVVVEKLDQKYPNLRKSRLKEKEKSKPPIEEKTAEVNVEVKSEIDSTKEESGKPKLKDFPLIIKSIEEAPDELLIDVHFLLFLNPADGDEVKKNILEFSGFTFDADTEDYDERNEFLQRMSNKIITDVSRCLSLGILSSKEDTIKNILSFLMNPDKSYLRESAISLSLSDVEVDDIGDMADSDSDESITCEVVEKNVECIEIISSGEDSDREVKPLKPKPAKKNVSPTKTSTANPSRVQPVTPRLPTSAAPQVAPRSNIPPPRVVTQPSVVNIAQPNAAETVSQTPPVQSGQTRTLGNFETICKIVNTHPPEYLVDIYELLYMRPHEPTTLRTDILSFTGFNFEKTSPDYVKRKQHLDRMLYNSVRRIYNTVIHNTTDVKVFSKPTMITEIFQFLFKLPDHDTSVRPQQIAKPVTKANNTVPITKVAQVVNTSLPTITNLTGKLSDLKRVFQRVACFPCEYLIDVHKLLFMTDCNQKSIRNNIFAFKGFDFDVNSEDFQKRKMYLEYLTFHSLRKISSVLTTRSVDLRNSTKHELATHLTQVLAEYTRLNKETEEENSSSSENPATVESSVSSSTSVEIVVTPQLPGFSNDESPTVSSSNSSQTTSSGNKPRSILPKTNSLGISIIDTHTVATPVVPMPVATPIVSSPTTNQDVSPRKRSKNKNTIKEKLSELQQKNSADNQQSAESTKYADINLPELEQYRQLYGQNLNIFTTTPISTIQSLSTHMPGITTITSSGVQQLVPQSMGLQLLNPYPQPIQLQLAQQLAQPPVQLPAQVIQVTSPGTPTIAPQAVSKNDVLVPVECVLSEEEPAPKRIKITPENEKVTIKKENTLQHKIREVNNEDDNEEDCDKPLASLIGHPIDKVLKKQIHDIIEQTNLQDITINGVIQKIYNLYPKFDLSYRKDFIKSTLRTLLYRLGEQNSADSTKDKCTDSPDCSVSTSVRDESLESPDDNSVES